MDADRRRPQLRCEVGQATGNDDFTGPGADLGLGERGSEGLDGRADAELTQGFDRVRPQGQPGTDLAQFGGALEDGRVEPGPPKCDASREPADPTADDEGTHCSFRLTIDLRHALCQRTDPIDRDPDFVPDCQGRLIRRDDAGPGHRALVSSRRPSPAVRAVVLSQ